MSLSKQWKQHLNFSFFFSKLRHNLRVKLHKSYISYVYTLMTSKFLHAHIHTHHPEQGLESFQLPRKLLCTTSLSTAHPRRSPLFWPLSPYSSEKDIFILEGLLVNRYLTLYTNNSNFLNWHKLSERTQGQVSKKITLKHTYIIAHQASLEFAQVHVPWVGDVIQPSHPLSPPFPPAFNLSQHQGLFQWVISSHQVAKVWVSASTGVLPMNTQDWSPLGSPCSPGDSQESSPTLQFKSINSSALSFFYSPTLTSIHDLWKNHSLD